MSPFHKELLAIMRADAAEIEDSLSVVELEQARARLDAGECHYVAVQAYWGYYPTLARLKDGGEHHRLRALADALEGRR